MVVKPKHVNIYGQKGHLSLRRLIFRTVEIVAEVIMIRTVKQRNSSCRRMDALSILAKACCWSKFALMVVCFWIMAPETICSTLTNDTTCEQTYGYLGNRITLRLVGPFSVSIEHIRWKKGSPAKDVLLHAPNRQSISKKVGEFKNRNVTAKDGVAGGSWYSEMNIHYSNVKDEGPYEIDVFPRDALAFTVSCPRIRMAIPPSMFNLSYVDGGSSISIPERKTDCTTGGITIKTNGTTTLRYNTASRPSSNITWNQVTDGSSVDSLLSDNTTQTTFEGDVTVKQGNTKLVKFTTTSQNPDFTAGPLVKEACIKIHHAGGSSPPGPTPGQLVAIIVGSVAGVVFIGAGVVLAMWKMRLACWKNTAEEEDRTRTHGQMRREEGTNVPMLENGIASTGSDTNNG